jgi:hypothetical protein
MGPTAIVLFWSSRTCTLLFCGPGDRLKLLYISTNIDELDTFLFVAEFVILVAAVVVFCVASFHLCRSLVCLSSNTIDLLTNTALYCPYRI